MRLVGASLSEPHIDELNVRNLIVAKCPGMTGTVPEFLHLSRSCPG